MKVCGINDLTLVSFVCFAFSSLIDVTVHSKDYPELSLPNTPDSFDNVKDFQNVDSPFRMQKVNMLWAKAKKRLPDNKLRVLYVDLKSQDKDELLLKKLKSEGQDEAGIRESAIRKQLTAIINKYGLSDPWVEPENNETAKDVLADPSADYINKQVFKDHKLNKLWLKAEQSGLGDMELDTLKEEFQHHQDKIDQYYMLVDRVNQPSADAGDLPNSIDAFLDEREQKHKLGSVNSHHLLKEKHRSLKENYDKLLGKISSSPQEFEEHAVQNLWELAQSAGFTASELSSLKSELHHYENRIRKLRFFQSELDVSSGHDTKTNQHTQSKPADQKHLYKKVKDYEYKVSKFHNELEGRILQRHSEL